MDEVEVIANEAVSVPVPNTEQIKDTAGNIPDKIVTHFKHGATFKMDETDYAHAIKNGVKVKAKDANYKPVNIEPEETEEKETEHPEE
jgi:hypothetical protein